MMDVVVKSGTYPNIAYEPYGWAGKEGNARLDSEMADWAYEDAHDGWRIDAPRDVVRGWVDSLRDECKRLERDLEAEHALVVQFEWDNEHLRGIIEEHSIPARQNGKTPIVVQAFKRIDELEAENDELREEYGWLYEFHTRMASHCGTKDVPSLVAYMDKLESENIELRGQVDSLRDERDWWRDECDEMYRNVVDPLADDLTYPLPDGEPDPAIMVEAQTMGEREHIDALMESRDELRADVKRLKRENERLRALAEDLWTDCTTDSDACAFCEHLQKDEHGHDICALERRMNAMGIFPTF